MANLILRSSTNQPLTFAELDGNFEYFTGSHAVTGSITASQGFKGNITGTASIATTASHALYALTASYALNGGTGNTSTGSLLTTASFSDPVITFIKGDGSTFGVDISDLTVTNTINAANAAYANLAGAANTATLAASATNATNAISSLTASYILGSGVDGAVTNAVTASYVNQLDQNLIVTGSISGSAGAKFQTLTIGTSGTINGNNILTTANTSQFVTSVNGILPTAGNVSVALTAVVTGTSASLITSGSGTVTGSLSQGLLWVISGDPTPENNGDVFIYTTSSLGAGQWIPIAPLDTAAGDARYVRQQGDGAITGSFTVSGSGVAINLLGNVKTYQIVDNSNLTSISASLRRLYDSTGDTILDWENKTFNGTAATASYVDLVAGPNITITQVGTTFEISGSAGGGSGAPGGSDSTIQFNDAGTFGGNGSFRFDDTSFSLLQGVFVSASGYVSHAQGNYTTSSGQYSHAEGISNTAQGIGSHAEGTGTIAVGQNSHAEGINTIASGSYSHAEGQSTIASGSSTHAEGGSTKAIGFGSHAEGQLTTALGDYSHVEGRQNTSRGAYSHAEGQNTLASGSYSHAEGQNAVARANYSHAEGQATLASGSYSHAEGGNTIASGSQSHSEGYFTIALGPASHAEGQQTTSKGSNSHAEGYFSVSSGSHSHAEGYSTVAIGLYSHTEGSNNNALGAASHAEGSFSYTYGLSSHTEGTFGKSYGDNSHAEGYSSTAGLGYWFTLGSIVNGLVSFASSLGDLTGIISSGTLVVIANSLYTVQSSLYSGGQTTIQLTDTTFNLGFSTRFSIIDPSLQISQSYGLVGNGSHAEGESTIAIGGASHAEGYLTIAIGNYSHAEGYLTKTNADSQHVTGLYNITSPVEGAFIIGNGAVNTGTPSNLLHAGGNKVEITGSLEVTGSLMSRNTTILTQVSESLNFVDDTAAAAGGVPLGGLYRNNNFVMIRIV